MDNEYKFQTETDVLWVTTSDFFNIVISDQKYISKANESKFSNH